MKIDGGREGGGKRGGRGGEGEGGGGSPTLPVTSYAISSEKKRGKKAAKQSKWHVESTQDGVEMGMGRKARKRWNDL